MSPSSRISLTNLLGIFAIILTIGGSATLLYSAVMSNKVEMEKSDERLQGEITDLQTSRDEERKLAIQTRESQIRMEEQMKELIRRGRK